METRWVLMPVPTGFAAVAGLDWPPLPVLSRREAEVAAQIAAGHSNKRIARELGLSPHTVKRHVANILAKLELESRSQVAAWWARGFDAAARPD